MQKRLASGLSAITESEVPDKTVWSGLAPTPERHLDFYQVTPHQNLPVSLSPRGLA